MLPAEGLCPALWGCLAPHSAFARPLPPPGVSGREAVPWLHLCQGKELSLGRQVQCCSEFCTQGQHLGPTFSQCQAWVLEPAGIIPSSSQVQHHAQFLILPPKPVASLPPAFKVETPGLLLPRHLYLLISSITFRVFLVLSLKHLSLPLPSDLDIPTSPPWP